MRLLVRGAGGLGLEALAFRRAGERQVHEHGKAD
jgi:hypothetical protein